MGRLNIPLGTISATRRPRRVVWILLFVPPFLALLVAGWWFTRPDIGLAAPENTQMIVRLQPGSAHWRDLLSKIGNLPAVSGRGITLADLAPYTEGDLALFIEQDGDWDTVIRSTKLPQALLDANGVYVQNIGHNLYLLSAQTRSIVPIKLKNPSFWRLIIGSQTVGSVFLRSGDKWISGLIAEGKDGWTLSLPKLPLGNLPWKNLPANTIAALSTPASTDSSNLSGITGPMDALLSQFHTTSIVNLANSWLKGPGLAILTANPTGPGVLVSGPITTLSPDDGKRLLAVASSAQSPSTSHWVLPDNSTADELTIDPSAIAISTKTINGVPITETSPSSNQQFIYTNNQGSYALANREDLVTLWLNPESASLLSEQQKCFSGGSMFINLALVYTASSNALANEQANELRILAKEFSAASVSNTWFSTRIHLCF